MLETEAENCILKKKKSSHDKLSYNRALPECLPVEEASFIKVVMRVLFQSSPKVATDEYLEEKRQISIN